jgi:hypothetical protein
MPYNPETIFIEYGTNNIEFLKPSDTWIAFYCSKKNIKLENILATVSEDVGFIINMLWDLLKDKGYFDNNIDIFSMSFTLNEMQLIASKIFDVNKVA